MADATERQMQDTQDMQDMHKNKEDVEALPGAGTQAGEELRLAHRAFEAGNFAQVKTLCEALQRAEDADVRREAAALKTRTTVDPLQWVLLTLCVCLFLSVVYTYLF